MKIPRIVTLLLVTLGGVLAFFFLRDSDTGRAGLVSMPEAQAQEEPSPSLQSPPPTDSREAEATDDSLVPSPPVVYPTIIAPIEEVITAPPDTWTLWLTLEAPFQASAVEVSILAQHDGDPFAASQAVQATLETNFRTRVDLSELLIQGKVIGKLLITAKHHSLRADTLNLVVPPVEMSSPTPPAPVEATIQMLAPLRLTGEVVKPSGDPTEARLGLWRFEAGQLETQLLVESGIQATGRFEEELPLPGEYLVVLAHQDFQPAWQRFTLLPGIEEHDTGLLRLGDGAELQGKFTVGGETPKSPVSFSLRREAEGTQLHWNAMYGGQSPGTLLWTGGNLERFGADQVTDDLGGFRVRGLQAGLHQMHLHGFAEGHGRMSREPIPLSAPARGLSIELAWSRIAVRLELEDPEQPPSAATLVLERTDHDPERNQLHGSERRGESEREFIFDALEPLTMRLEIPGLEPMVRELRAPAAGGREEVIFAVPRQDLSASLRLNLTGELPPPNSSFFVHVASSEEAAKLASLGHVEGQGSAKVPLKDGALLLEGLRPGPMVVLAYESEWAGLRSSFLLDATIEVQLQSGQETVASLRLESGGRLRVGKRNGSDGWSWARCQIRDASQEELETTFVAYAPDGGGGTSSSAMLPDMGPSVVVPNLSPGHYEVQVGDESRRVEVLRGEITEVFFD